MTDDPRDWPDIWEISFTDAQARTLVATVDSLLEGQNADAFKDEERAVLELLRDQVRSDLS